MIWPLIAGGAGLGFLKALRDQENEKGDRELAAVTAQYSPWTKMQPREVKKADFLGSMAEGALGGASFGQGMENTDAYQRNLDAKTALAKEQTIGQIAANANQKNMALTSMFEQQRANNLEQYGHAVTDAELAQDYEDDNSPDPVSAWHPPMAKPKR